MTDLRSAHPRRGALTTPSRRVLVAIVVVAGLLWVSLLSVQRASAAEGLVLSPTHGQAGDISTATGSGFVGGTVELSWDGGGTLVSGAVDGSGGFAIDITLDAAPGSYTVTACATITLGCDGGTATAGYTVDAPPTIPPPALELTSGSGQPGDGSSAVGTGFPATVGIDLTWDNAVLTTDTTDGSGGFTIPFTIPLDAAPGTYTVGACATGTNPCDTATATYTVDAAPTPTPTSAASPTTRPSPGLTATPEPTTTHLLTAGPSITLAPGQTATPSPSPSSGSGTTGGGGGGGGPVDPTLLLLAGAFIIVLVGAWAYFRYGPTGEHERGPVFGPTTRLAAGLFLGGILLAVVAGSVIADAGRPHQKVVICHLDTLHGTYRPISIDGAAVVVHQLRGDVLPDAAGRCP